MLALILAAALEQAVAPPPPPSTGIRPSIITQPDWLKRPDAALMERYYPRDATKYGLEGAALIACKVATTGYLEGCAVTQESPRGAGFGDAALSLAARFRMLPMTKDGQPAAGGRINIPIRFRTPNPSPLPPQTREVILKPDLELLATADDVAQAYPAQARPSGATGEVLMRCAAADGGELRDCVALQERPQGLGFGEAAATLAGKFRLKPAADGHAQAGAMVFFPIRLRPRP